MSKKVFRHTPHRAADAMKIIVGNKTNATIRDVEETLEDIEEKEGVIKSIDKDKITGNGWVVQDSDGVTYNCNCGFSMYELPETEEYGGIYYPTEQVSVKFTINPMLRTNTITEITSLGSEEEKIDLSKWKHGDKATTVIAKPKSAISISNAIISFNYNNENKVTADEDEVKTSGKSTNVATNVFNINSREINIQGVPLEDYVQNTAKDTNINQQKDQNIDITQQNNLGQININSQNRTIYIPSNYNRIIKDLIDPSMYPERAQRQPLLTGNNIHELYIYPNGLVTVQARTNEDINEKIFSTHQWITTQNIYKNLLKVSVLKMCDCCAESINGEQIYFNYCPHCKTWNTLYNNYNVITCNTCHKTWCQSCGHEHTSSCSDKSLQLKKYNEWVITAIGLPCSYCKNEIPYGKTREYANYCPKCHTWGYLQKESEYDSEGNEQRFLHCTYSGCGEKYCINCSISQGTSFIKNFLNDNTAYNYNNFLQKYWKLTHIRDD